MSRRALALVCAMAVSVTAQAQPKSPTPTADLEYGDPIHFRNITLVPIHANAAGPFARYTLLEAGLAARTFQVRERAGQSSEAQVASVEVKNQGQAPVFLLSGEMILGGKQDRIIQSDAVIPADGKWHELAVFCVEQGRWQGQKMEFEGGGAVAHLKLQEAAMSGQQDKVWAEVARKNREHGTSSDTQTYRRTIQNPKVRGQIAHYRRALEQLLPSAPSTGYIFAINGQIQVADVFNNPLLFADLREKLLSSYILEALEHQVDAKAKPLPKAAAAKFVGDSRAAPASKSTVNGKARSVQKEDATHLGSETYDQDNGESIRSSYINKAK